MPKTVRVLAISSLAILASCYAQIQYRDAADGPELPAACPQSAPLESLVGVALSGGGSRAAVFGAAALEALGEHGLMGKISHLSSVSGGSIAAAYYTTQLPDCGAFPAGAERDTCLREFFRDFKRTMRHDWWSSMRWRGFLNFRLGANSKRATSLAEVLDGEFLDSMRFGDLPPKPTLFVNAASYDEARRFVFSNGCLSPDPGWARALSFSRPGCERPAPADFPLSLAVAASASFPPVIGPVSLEIPAECRADDPEYWHLGDGGVIDNSGVDALEEIFLRERERRRGTPRRALIISLDSGKKTSPESLNRIENFWLLFKRPGRVVDVAQARGHAYHELFWDELAAEGVALERVVVRHGDATLSRWPESCADERDPNETDAERRASIRTHLREIDTWLSIDACNADLMEAAAHQLVHHALHDERVRELRALGFPLVESAHSHP